MVYMRRMDSFIDIENNFTTHDSVPTHMYLNVLDQNILTYRYYDKLKGQ